MKQRVARFGAVLFAVLGLVASLAPPAHAIGVTTVVFTGVFSMGNGMSYPCVTGKAPSPPNPPQFDPAKCPPNTPNTVWWTFTGAAISSTAKVAKTKCLLTDIACAQVTTSNISGAGTIKGNCSTWTGTGTWSKSDFDIINTKEYSASTTMNVSFVSVGGLNVLNGTASRPGLGNNGIVVGAFHAQAESPTNSCWDKRPKTWVVAGGYTVIWPN